MKLKSLNSIVAFEVWRAGQAIPAVESWDGMSIVSS